MTGVDDVGKTILRNKLLGRWAAEKLGLTGPELEAYSDTLARATVDPERSDVFSKIRKDFDEAGITESNERILQVMTELTLKAGNLMPTATGNSVDGAAVALARKLTTP
ncbi:ATPase inhibitor subunit zeta [Microvirga calopogonii]|uniref:ATPase inhibitor subunit zeta n=1 Tax=Microvirga calopogonii TaxID=2078013 RepID=UPI000E0D40F1|nr:ATPase inhibitor subunit zeta [Microvirga calopogonii]